jgi:transcriptional pleiotropic regulator of transition state genes
MKDTGIVRHIDDLGRIVIPLEIYVKGDRIVLGKPHDGCTFCGRSRDLVEHYGRLVCAACRDELANGGTQTEPEGTTA